MIPGIELPSRIQLSRAKGWRMPAGAVKVDRSTIYGNPFYVGQDGDAAECVRRYRQFLMGAAVMPSTSAGRHRASGHPLMPRLRHDLRGKPLACWCALGAPCHADVLLELANAP